VSDDDGGGPSLLAMIAGVALTVALVILLFVGIATCSVVCSCSYTRWKGACNAAYFGIQNDA